MAKIDSWGKLQKSLRWKADMRIINDFGEDVWLKPYIKNGKRIGITECCFADNPCSKHKKMMEQQALAAKEKR